jgi:hypothetical protein
MDKNSSCTDVVDHQGANQTPGDTTVAVWTGEPTGSTNREKRNPGHTGDCQTGRSFERRPKQERDQSRWHCNQHKAGSELKQGCCSEYLFHFESLESVLASRPFCVDFLVTGSQMQCVQLKKSRSHQKACAFGAVDERMILYDSMHCCE